MSVDDDPEYEVFVASMAKFCSCDYDCPCDSVLAGGPCERKTEEPDHTDRYDEPMSLEEFEER